MYVLTDLTDGQPPLARDKRSIAMAAMKLSIARPQAIARSHQVVVMLVVMTCLAGFGLHGLVMESARAHLAGTVSQQQARFGSSSNLTRQQQCNLMLSNLLSKGEPQIADGFPSEHPRPWTTAERTRQSLIARLNAWHSIENSFIDEGHTGERAAVFQQQMYLALALVPCIKTVCEIGFNAGHSAAVFMSVKDINLISFDLGEHPYTLTALRFFMANYPGRITTTFGNSTASVRAFAARVGQACDMLIVDGGHDYVVAVRDIINMQRLAKPDFNLFVIDDTNCNMKYCKGPDQALREAEQTGLVSITYRASLLDSGEKVGPELRLLASRGFSIGQYNTTWQR